MEDAPEQPEFTPLEQDPELAPNAPVTEPAVPPPAEPIAFNFTPAPPEIVAVPEPTAPRKTGVELLKELYAHPESGEPVALKWKPQDQDATRFNIESHRGLLLLPDETVAEYDRDEAQAVFAYLSALRPRDEIKIKPVQ